MPSHTVTPFTIHTPASAPLAAHEQAVLDHLLNVPFSRQHEISKALSLPGDHHNWLTFAALRTLQDRQLVASMMIPGPSRTRRPIKVWHPISTPRLVLRASATRPMRKRDILARWFTLLARPHR